LFAVGAGQFTIDIAGESPSKDKWSGQAEH
jgi:hypothetical protein